MSVTATRRGVCAGATNLRLVIVKTLTWFFVIFLAASIPHLVLATPAGAHDVLIEASPGVNATIESAPTEARLRFSGEPLTGHGLTNIVRVTDAEGHQWQTGETRVEGPELAVDLCPGMPQGEYRLTFRVIYSDGHTGEEGYSFTLADPSAPDSAVPDDCGVIFTAEQPDSSTQFQGSDSLSITSKDRQSTLPTWLWVVAGLGIALVLGVLVLLLKGGKNSTPQTQAEPSDSAE